jgi:flagellar protein FlaJ
MKWYRFWQKHSEKGAGEKDSRRSFDKELLDMDFFCQLSYMAAIATSGISRSGLFYHAARLPYVSARYFKRVAFVAKAFNHDYSEACNIVGQATKELEVKGLLLRLSGALSSGEDIATFLERESQVFSESYGNRYEGRLEVLKKWTDAYVALIMTSAIVTVMAVVTTMVGNVTIAFIIALCVLTILVTVGGAWLIYRSAPKETKVHSLSSRSTEQNLARSVAKLTLPAGGIVILCLLVMKVDIGWLMLIAGVFLFPVGLISKIDDNKINKRDTDIAGFLRSLGGVSQAIGATVNEAMGRLDFRSMGYLKNNVNLLYTRLTARIDPNLCWEWFVGSTGSEQVSRSVRIFWDGVTLGGEPERVGNDASGFAMKIALLRAKRGLVASGAFWLTIVMHTIITVLVVFIYRTLITFSTLIQAIIPDLNTTQAVSGISSFGVFSSDSAELQLLHSMVIVIVVVLSFTNAFAIYATGGGHIYKLLFYLTMTMAISGAAVIFVPPVVNMMFTGF